MNPTDEPRPSSLARHGDVRPRPAAGTLNGRVSSVRPVFLSRRARSTVRPWTINGRFATQPMTGVQRDAREIVSALDDLISEGHPLARDLSIEFL